MKLRSQLLKELPWTVRLISLLTITSTEHTASVDVSEGLGDSPEDSFHEVEVGPSGGLIPGYLYKFRNGIVVFSPILDMKITQLVPGRGGVEISQ